MLKRVVSYILGILLLFKNVISQPTWVASPQMATGNLYLYNNIPKTNCFNSSQIPISYYLPIPTSVTFPFQTIGIGIVGFDSFFSHDFLVNISVSYLSNTSFSVSMKVSGDTTICMYAIDWIILGQTVNFTEIQFACFLCSNMGKGVGLRTDTTYGMTSFIGQKNLVANVYLNGFLLTNNGGLVHFLSASAIIPPNNSTIIYTFSTTQANIVTQVCYTTIIYCYACTQVTYLDFVLVGYQDFSTSQSTNFPTPQLNPPFVNIPNWAQPNCMFFGMSQFSISLVNQREFYLQTSANNYSLNYYTNSGINNIQISYFWYAIREPCTNPQWFIMSNYNCQSSCSFYDSSIVPSTNDICTECHYSCATCIGPLFTDCSTCDQSFFRIKITTTSPCKCSSGYLDIGDTYCYPCNTLLIGCNLCDNSYKCIQCQPGFQISSISGTCVCTTGYLVSGICTNITGCTALILQSGTALCIACNATLHFQTNANYTCSCLAGYYVNVNTFCSSLCGDGQQTQEQACDDGNTLNGDGCSSVCTIEKDWLCVNGSISSPSQCYMDTPFTFTVVYIRRIINANQMQVALQISPNNSQMSFINQRFITTDIPCTKFNIKFENGLLIIIFDYNQTIQGNIYSLDISLDPNYFQNSSYKIEIPTSGMNGKLTYDDINSVNYPLQIIVLVLDCLAILVLCISCISEKMIGIQMIQTLQTVLFTQSVMKTTPSSFMPLQMLRYSSGFNEVEGIDHARTYTFQFSLSSIGLQKQFLLSYNVMYIILIAVIIICVFFKIKQLHHQTDIGKFQHINNKKKIKQKLDTTTKIFNFAFERILFLVAFISMFLIIFAIMLQLTDMHSRYLLLPKQLNLLGTLIAICVLVTIISVVIINGFFPGTLLFPMLMKQYYPPTYFIYQSTFIILLASNYTQQHILYILEGLSLLFLIFNILYRPYNQWFHTFVLIFHQLFIMGVMGIWIFQNLTTPIEHQTLYKIINACIIALLYIVVGLNTYRLYRYYQFLKNNGWDQYGNPAQIDDMQGNDLLTYKKAYEDMITRRKQNGQQSSIHQQQNNNKIIKPSQTKRPKQPKNPSQQDDYQINWQHNKLAENVHKSSRYPYTNREQIPQNNTQNNQQGPINEKLDKNTQIRNQPRQKTPQKPFLKSSPKNNSNSGNANQYDEENHVVNENNKEKEDNPYDQLGFPKKNKNTNKGQEQNQLENVKNKYRMLFGSKIKTPTLVQK